MLSLRQSEIPGSRQVEGVFVGGSHESSLGTAREAINIDQLHAEFLHAKAGSLLDEGKARRDSTSPEDGHSSHCWLTSDLAVDPYAGIMIVG